MTAILIDDDDPDIRDLVVFTLEQASYDVIAVDNGLTALSAARENPPDPAVLDVMTPGTPIQTFRPAHNPTHDGVDTMLPRNTPIASASAGRVLTVECNTSGPSCDLDGGPSVRGCGWYIEIAHPGQVTTRYCHLVRRPPVALGQEVKAGQTIGYVGTSGNSSGPHLHFEVHVGPGPATRANAVDPLAFMRRMNAPLGVFSARR
jgi:murein DD-endopeptidase MepM/ murein hydrolase activator NlpD